MQHDARWVDGHMTFVSLPDALAAHARAAPERIAVVIADDACTYGELCELIERATAMLAAQGIAAGDRVAWLGLNHSGQLVALAALMRLGAILVPLNYRLAAAELQAIVGHAGAAAVIADEAFGDMAAAFGVRVIPRAALTATDAADAADRRGRALPSIGPDTPALLVYTSGTTGQPKGAVHTHAGLWWNAQASIAMHEITAGDRVLTVLPLFHVGGLCIQTIPALYAGAAVHLHPRFDPGAWLAAVDALKPTISLMVPATMRAVIEHPRWQSTGLQSLRILGAGSSTIPDALIEAFHARGVPVCQIYGATETGPVSIVLRADEAMAHVGAAGRPVPGCAIRLVDREGRDATGDSVGEILVSAPNVMRGYWREPSHPSFAGGWFRTGDLARRDADGFYTVVGRVQDMIISGGENIYPAEIENLLAGIPEIADAAALGVPDPQWGEVPVAIVVLRPGAALSAEAILARLDGRLARFKQPKRIVFRATLPRNAMGKVQKRMLIDELTRG